MDKMGKIGKIAILFYLAILALCDWRERKVPLVLLAAGGLAATGMKINELLRNTDNWRWMLVSVLLGILPGLLMLAVARLTAKAGYGDGLALLILGLFTDYMTCMALLCFSMLIMSLFSIAMLSVKKVRRETKLPYLPFLAAVYAAGIFW